MKKPKNQSIPLLPYILIVEDAVGVSLMYKELLEDKYLVKVCNSGKEVNKFIDKGHLINLAIMDMLLPPEDPNKRTLIDCTETGLRLMREMIDRNICKRFFVITAVSQDTKKQIEQLCKDKGAVLKLEHKLDYRPEKLVENVATLLSQPIDDMGKNVLSELDEHLRRIEQSDPSIDQFNESEKVSLMVSLEWIKEVLDSSPFQMVLIDQKARKTWYRRFKHTLDVLENRYSGYITGELNEVTDNLKIAIMQFLKN